MKYTKVEGFHEFPEISHLIISAKSITDVPKNVNKKSDGFSAIQFSGKHSKFHIGLGKLNTDTFKKALAIYGILGYN